MPYTDDDSLGIDFVDNIEDYEYKSIDNYITFDHKKLHLSYPSIKDDKNLTTVERYDEYLDELDTRYDIFDTVEDLYFETDFISALPPNILKFKNLKIITICGSRFDNLRFTDFSNNVEEIYVSGSNLDTFMHIGLENKHKLKKMTVDHDLFNMDLGNNNYSNSNLNNIFPISDLPLLDTIIININDCWTENDLRPNYKENIMNHILFSNIQYRISNININKSKYNGYIDSFTVSLIPASDDNILHYSDSIELIDLEECPICYSALGINDIKYFNITYYNENHFDYESQYYYCPNCKNFIS